MTLILRSDILAAIYAAGSAAYPEEGAGLLLGKDDGNERRVTDLISFRNAREEGARHNRFLITPQDMLRGEREAVRRGLDVVGVYHSHPDHPNRPSEFDREWALPWYSYVITSVYDGSPGESRSWRLQEDRQMFQEEAIQIHTNPQAG